MTSPRGLFKKGGWLKLGGRKGGKAWGMNEVVVGRWKSLQSDGIGLAFPPSARTVDKHCVLMSGSLIRINKNSMWNVCLSSMAERGSSMQREARSMWKFWNPQLKDKALLVIVQHMWNVIVWLKKKMSPVMHALLRSNRYMWRAHSTHMCYFSTDCGGTALCSSCSQTLSNVNYKAISYNFNPLLPHVLLCDEPLSNYTLLHIWVMHLSVQFFSLLVIYNIRTGSLHFYSSMCFLYLTMYVEFILLCI